MGRCLEYIHVGSPEVRRVIASGPVCVAVPTA